MKTNANLLAALITAFILCVAVSLSFVSPVMKGKELKQFDITQFKGSYEEIKQFREKGRDIYWTNSMFSGMPAYLISVQYKTNIFNHVRNGLVTWLPDPAGKIFLLLISFYLMLLCMKVDPWISLGGAVAFAFSSYFIIVLAAGHNNKVIAIAFLPILFGGLYYTFRRNPYVGSAIFAIAMSLEIVANHPQMTYYFGFFAAAFVLTELIAAVWKNKVKNFAIGLALTIVATILAVGTNYNALKSINEYGKYSTRSKSELTLNKENQTTGLDRDYITGWSNGVSETFSLLIPNFKGGETAAIGSNHKEALEGIRGPMKEMVAQSNAYWGDQPGVGGPVYVGAFILVLFAFSLFYVKDRLKWPVLFTSILIIMMSWGKNFQVFTDLLIDYFPLYSKFRAVASILIVVNLTIPLFALYGISKMAEEENMKDKAVLLGIKLPISWMGVFFIVSGFFAFLTLLFAVAPGSFTSLFATGEAEKLSEQLSKSGADSNFIETLLDAIATARASILRSDALRSLLFIVLGTLMVWSYARFKYNKYILAFVFLFLTLGDLYLLDGRYLNASNFVAKNKNQTVPPTESDKYILSDPTLYYRTANLSVSTFNDATTSFYHKSIGGYHGAKLKIYQELVEYVLSDELMNIQLGLQQNPTVQGFEETMRNAPALNMLNTKYFIFGPEGPGAVLRNNSALGNAWFPSKVIQVQSADEEITKLKGLDAKNEVLVRSQYTDILAGASSAPDSVSSVKLTAYDPEKLTYDVNATADKVMVMSEIWYPDGWKAYVDGNEVPIARANYVLRAIKVPAGKHTVEMSFESSFKKDENISLIFSIIIVAFIALMLFSGRIPAMRHLIENE